VAIETDKNLLVAALQAAGMAVYAINPRAVARYRDRHGQSGKKSDPGDAAILANILRTDRPMYQHGSEPADPAWLLRARKADPGRPVCGLPAVLCSDHGADSRTCRQGPCPVRCSACTICRTCGLDAV